MCAEQGVIGWLITYFVDTGLLGSSLSQLMASVLWVMILTGRLTVAGVSGKVQKEKLLVIMGFGYSMAGIYPTTVSFCGRLIQKYAIAWSFILTMASLGSILMPMIITLNLYIRKNREEFTDTEKLRKAE